MLTNKLITFSPNLCRFSSLYDSFYEHPTKLSKRNSSDLLVDLHQLSLADSGFQSRPSTDQRHPPTSSDHHGHLTSPRLTFSDHHYPQISSPKHSSSRISDITSPGLAPQIEPISEDRSSLASPPSSTSLLSTASGTDSTSLHLTTGRSTTPVSAFQPQTSAYSPSPGPYTPSPGPYTPSSPSISRYTSPDSPYTSEIRRDPLFSSPTVLPAVIPEEKVAGKLAEIEGLLFDLECQVS